jgi:DNA polymerase-1
MSMEGIPIGEDALKASTAEVNERIRVLEQNLRDLPWYTAVRRKYGKEANLRARAQLGWALYEHMGLPGGRKDKNGNWAVDKEELADLDLAELVDYGQLMKLDKLKGTYLGGIHRELVNGRIHPAYSLTSVATYRSSAYDPSVQNFPLRDKMQGRIIRSCIVPPPGYAIVEVDESGAEVRSACCYHKDAIMIADLASGYDMHKEIAAGAFILPIERVDKDMRQTAKGFVFSQQYGSTYKAGARKLWKQMDKLIFDGSPIKEHLANCGIRELGRLTKEGPTPGSFYAHIKKVEAQYWARYATYDHWRHTTFNQYNQRGFMHTLTGFRIHGVYGFTEIVNYAPQGSAFHWLLGAIVDATKELEQRRMRSRLICQIHDSILGLVPLDELDDYVNVVSECMTTRVLERWPWINVPILAEAEWSDVSWHDKKPYERAA